MIGHETRDGRSFPRHSDLTPTEIDEVNQPKMLVIILESLPIMMVTQPVVHSRSESGLTVQECLWSVKTMQSSPQHPM